LTGAFLERLGACRAALWRVVEDGRRGGAIASALVALIVLGLDDFATGQWDEMQRLVDELLDLAGEHGYGLQRWSGLHLSALIAAVRGDDETVRAVTDDLMQWAVPRQVQTVVRFAHHARGVAALGRGDYEQAFRHLDAISPSGTLESHVPNAMWVLLDVAEAAVGAGRHDEAVAHLKAMREHDVAALSPRFALAVAATAAMTASDDEAEAMFAAAIAIPGIDRWVFDVARVQLAYGQYLRRVRSTDEARTQLMSALSTFDRIGARPWATRARNELRATGRTQAHAGDAVALTPQEHEIAELAASGLTNKEIGARLYLSHRTVGAHLHRIFPKLGITSRAALRDALSRLDAERTGQSVGSWTPYGPSSPRTSR
jgi:DNA-binding CsgD family transcriptional regulator